MIVLDAEGGIAWHEVRRDVAQRMALLGDEITLAGEPLDAATWGLSPDQVRVSAVHLPGAEAKPRE